MKHGEPPRQLIVINPPPDEGRRTDPITTAIAIGIVMFFLFGSLAILCGVLT